MSVKCRFMTEKPNNELFCPLDVITGVIHFTVTKRTGYKFVIKSIIGIAGGFWCFPQYTPEIISCDTIYTANKILVSKREVVVEEDYDYRFAFRPHCDITSIKIWYQAVWIPHDCNQLEIPDNGYVSYAPLCIKNPFYYLPSNYFRIEKKLFSLLGNKTPNLIKFKVEMDQYVWSSGEYGRMVYTVDNRSNVDIRSVETNFYNIISVRRRDIRLAFKIVRDISHDFMKQERLRIPAGAKVKLCVEYPIPENIRTKNGNRYEFRVTLKLPLPHFNIVAAIPVLVGKSESFPLIDRLKPDENLVISDELRRTCNAMSNLHMGKFFPAPD